MGSENGSDDEVSSLRTPSRPMHWPRINCGLGGEDFASAADVNSKKSLASMVSGSLKMISWYKLK
jgi:hypothetical protein